jgi:FlgD Ig-like domain
MSRTLVLGAVAVLAAILPHSSAATPSDDPTTLYQLIDNSNFEAGCFGPCACPVITTSAIRGTFLLHRVSVDPLYTTYAVSDVRWNLPDLPTPVQIQGSGTYKVGGEFAVQEEMVLDLAFDSGAPLHFDSGLVPGGGEFPDINVRVSLHQNTACRDTVLDLKAKPAVSTSAGGPGGRRAVVSVVNPFRASADIRLNLARTERVGIQVFDARGRLVRQLEENRATTAGASLVPWDGLNDRGVPVAAGIYIFRVQTEEGFFVRRAVKLK